MPPFTPPRRLAARTRATRSAFALANLAILALAACGREEREASNVMPAGGADAAAPAALTTGLSTPESVLWDAARNAWYVSNINGSPTAKDDNGYILRLAANGTIMDSVPFINGADDDVTLNGPKGLALTGDTLWVADIDAVRAFDVTTGNQVASIDLTAQRATFLNDAVAGPDGTVYITDSGIAFDASGNVSHPGRSRVFAIRDGKASEAVALAQGAAPNGIAWDATRDALVIVSFAGSDLWSWAPGSPAATVLGSGVGGADGVVVLADGRALYTSWTDSSLNAFSNGTSRTLRKGLPSPADIGFDPARSVVAVPLFSGDRVEFWVVPTDAASAKAP